MRKDMAEPLTCCLLWLQVMWSCNCAFVFPYNVTPGTAAFGDDGGWLDKASGVYNISAEWPRVVETENHCVGDDRSGGLFGVDPTVPTSVSQCYWDNRPYNFDEVRVLSRSIDCPAEHRRGASSCGCAVGGQVGHAMMALFTASTLAGWTDIMEAAMDQTGIGSQPLPFNKFGFVIYFMAYVLVMAFFVTNLFVGVLIDFIGTNDGSSLLTDDQQAMQVPPPSALCIAANGFRLLGTAACRACPCCAESVSCHRQDTMKYAKLHRPELARTAPDNPLRKWCWGLVESKCWTLTSNGFILFNVVVMMCEYQGQSVQWWLALELMNLVCLIFFTVEMFIKLIGWGPMDATVYLLHPLSVRVESRFNKIVEIVTAG